MKRFAACLLVVLAAPVLAQNSSNVDAQLLAAQMAYQAADGKQEQARRQLQQADADLKLAEKRLADAQQALQQAQQQQAQAAADKQAADAVMQQVTQRLKDAWQQKEGQ